MRYLGIDYGEKNIGLALSDEEGKIAIPYMVVGSLGGVVLAVKKENVGKIVVGLPIGFSGKDTKQTIIVRKFAEILQKKVKLSIEFENEILSTRIASEFSSKNKIDASSAAVILQSYLDKNAKL